jgi:hypothetical protein
VARRRLENELSDLTFPCKTNAANERLAQHPWAHRDELFTFLRQPGLDATNWRAELAIRFGVNLRNVWGGSRGWPGARAQSVLMSVGGRAGSRGVVPWSSSVNCSRERLSLWLGPRDLPDANPHSSKDASAIVSPLIRCPTPC